MKIQPEQLFLIKEQNSQITTMGLFYQNITVSKSEVPTAENPYSKVDKVQVNLLVDQVSTKPLINYVDVSPTDIDKSLFLVYRDSFGSLLVGRPRVTLNYTKSWEGTTALVSMDMVFEQPPIYYSQHQLKTLIDRKEPVIQDIKALSQALQMDLLEIL